MLTSLDQTCIIICNMNATSNDTSIRDAATMQEHPNKSNVAASSSQERSPRKISRDITSHFATPPLPHFKTTVFEGPLDLLIHLIRANEVDITDIPIAEITEQYLTAMELIDELDLTAAGEYLVIAATLIEIKARMLLPQRLPEGEDEPEDPRAELVARLLEYQQYQSVVETMQGWEDQRRRIFFRGALENSDDYILPVPEGEAHVSQLYQALTRLLAESGLNDALITTITPRRRLSLRLAMAGIARKIAGSPDGIAFESLFELPCSRYEIVLIFLALLELLRFDKVRFEQLNILGSIVLFPISMEENRG